MTVVDLDGDGRAEIVAPPARREPEPRPHVWSRSASGEWTELPNRFPKASFGYGDVAAGDFNKDGRMDLALAMHSIGVAVFLAGADGSWSESTQGLPAGGQFPTRALTVGDFDGDGWTDVVTMAEMTSRAGRGNPGLRFYRNLEGKGWRPEAIPGVDEIFGDRLIAHADGGKAAIFFAGSLVHGLSDVAWRRTEQGWRSLSEGLPNDVIYWDLATCDVDGDGSVELFAAVDAPRARKVTGTRMFVRTGDRWVDRSEGLPATPSRAIAVADMQGDQTCAVAITNVFSGEVKFYRHASKGGWQEWATAARPEKTAGNPYGIVLADVDADRRLDVVVNYAADPSAGAIQVWRRK